MGFSGGSVVKKQPAKQETWVRSLGQEDPQGNGNPLIVLAWEIPWTEEIDGLPSNGLQKSWT